MVEPVKEKTDYSQFRADPEAQHSSLASSSISSNASFVSKLGLNGPSRFAILVYAAFSISLSLVGKQFALAVQIAFAVALGAFWLVKTSRELPTLDLKTLVIALSLREGACFFASYVYRRLNETSDQYCGVVELWAITFPIIDPLSDGKPTFIPLLSYWFAVICFGSVMAETLGNSVVTLVRNRVLLTDATESMTRLSCYRLLLIGVTESMTWLSCYVALFSVIVGTASYPMRAQLSAYRAAQLAAMSNGAEAKENVEL